MVHKFPDMIPLKLRMTETKIVRKILDVIPFKLGMTETKMVRKILDMIPFKLRMTETKMLHSSKRRASAKCYMQVQAQIAVRACVSWICLGCDIIVDANTMDLRSLLISLVFSNF